MKKRVLWLRLKNGRDIMLKDEGFDHVEIAKSLNEADWAWGHSAVVDDVILSVRSSEICWFSVEEVEFPDPPAIADDEGEWPDWKPDHKPPREKEV